MPSIVWEVSYSVDVASMDRQHQKIFDHMATIYSALSDKSKSN